MHIVFILLVSFTDPFFHQGVELVSIEKWPFSAFPGLPVRCLQTGQSIWASFIKATK